MSDVTTAEQLETGCFLQLHTRYQSRSTDRSRLDHRWDIEGYIRLKLSGLSGNPAYRGTTKFFILSFLFSITQ